MFDVCFLVDIIMPPAFLDIVGCSLALFRRSAINLLIS